MPYRTSGKWGDIRDCATKEEAAEYIQRQKQSDPQCKYRIKVKRMQSNRWQNDTGQDRYFVQMLCPGLY